MTYRPSWRRSRVTSSARPSSSPTRHYDCDDAGYADGLATRTSTITYQTGVEIKPNCPLAWGMSSPEKLLVPKKNH